MRKPTSNETYRGVFEAHAAGAQILEELTARFYDIQSYKRGDPHETAFNEGQRNVVRFVLARLAQIETDGEE